MHSLQRTKFAWRHYYQYQHEATRGGGGNLFEQWVVKLTSVDEIKQHIAEAEARIEIAKHYGIPYPRLVNIPPNVLTSSGSRSRLKGSNRALKQSKPVYIKSYSEDK